MTATTVFIVENGKLVKYQRNGKCEKCGECCGIYNTITYSMKVAFVDRQPGDTATNKDGREYEDWSEWEGWSIFYAQGIWFYFRVLSIEEKPSRCSEQGDDGLCTIWNDEEHFPPICRYWPFNPKDIEAFPDCGFSFERIKK